MQSMTGYGRGDYESQSIKLTVELKTVNNRFLDISAKYPRSFISLDELIKKQISSAIKRGRVEAFISYENLSLDSAELKVDKSLALAYKQASLDLSNFLQMDSDYTLTSVMRQNGVITEQPKEENLEDIKLGLKTALNLALNMLIEMRKAEGQKLKEDLLNRLKNISSYVYEIEQKASNITVEYREKLITKITDFLKDVNYNEERMLQEVALYADKSNIDEEITRLKSHIVQFESILSSGEEVGKKLDFLLQEFNRESNTICSKSSNIDITKCGLNLKNEIEKIREQIQNLQ